MVLWEGWFKTVQSGFMETLTKKTDARKPSPLGKGDRGAVDEIPIKPL